MRAAIELRRSATALTGVLAAAVIAACGIGAAFVAGHTGYYERLASWAGDLEQRMTAQPMSFPRAVVFDIDAESMQRLRPQLGEWPYKRDIFALVTNWLWRSGAHAVVFDFPLVEASPGDQAFAAALAPRAVLPAFAVTGPMEPREPREPREPGTRDSRSGVEGLRVAGVAPGRLASSELALPRLEFTSPGGAHVGVVADAPQRTAGRAALLHPFRGKLLADLPLAALLAASDWPPVTVAAGRLGAGDWVWPVTDAGEVFLRYPSNPGDLPVVPFYRLALAAAGVPAYASLASEVRGRTVFIGSSRAVPADVPTPFGPRAGLHHAALATEMLAQERVSLPGSALIDTLLFALALAWPLSAVARAGRARARDHLAAAAAALVLPVAAGIGLFAAGQASHWLFAAVAGLFAELFGAAWWLSGIRENRRAHPGASDAAGPSGTSLPAGESRSDAAGTATFAGDAPGEAAARGVPAAIRIDPAVRHLVPKFLELCCDDVAQMRNALEAGRFEDLRNTGHKLKGSGGSYGFDEITLIGAGVEAAAASEDRARLRELIGELARYLERVRPAFE